MTGKWVAATEDRTEVVGWISADIADPPLVVIAFESKRDARIAASVLNDLDAAPFGGPS